MVDFEEVFANLKYPCCIVDASGQVLAWNTAMQLLTNLPRADAVGASLGSLGMIPEALYQSWQGAQDAIGQDVFQINKRTYRVFFMPLADAAWSILVSIGEDQNDLLYTILHDLQNPLAAIKGYVELVENIGGLNEKQEHYLGRVNIAIEDITELASHLLDVTWIDAGIAINPKPVNFAHLTHSIASAYIIRAQKKDITLKLEINPIPLVMCDERRIKQVINNLVGNAIKYSLDAGEVVVSITETDEGVEFSVTDQGIGIPEEFLDKIFQRFFRVPGDHIENIQGNGLGLSISYEILKKHGSTLKVESTPGKGSRFYFTLPIAEEDEKSA